MIWNNSVRVWTNERPRFTCSAGGALRLFADQEFDAPLRRAIGRARQALLDRQLYSGEIRCQASATAAAQAKFVLLRCFLADRHDEAVDAAARGLIAQQRPDGGWSNARGAFCLNTSVLGYFALKLAGYGPATEPATSARRAILACGGVAGIDSATRSWLALFDQIPHRVAEAPGLERFILPTWLPGSISPAAKAADPTLLARSLVAALGMRRYTPPHLGVRELFTTSPDQWPSTARHRLPSMAPRLLRRRAISAVRKELLDSIDRWPSDSQQNLDTICWTTIALESLGFVAGTAVRNRVEEQLAPLLSSDGETLSVEDGAPSLMDTALAAAALCQSGLDRDYPALQDAVAWLGTHQPQTVADAAALLNTLTTLTQATTARPLSDSLLPPPIQLCGADRERESTAIQTIGELGSLADQMVRQLLAAQRPDGAWSSVGSSDLLATAFALKTLAAAGSPAADTAIHRGVIWLLGQQRPDGSWRSDAAAADEIATTASVLEAVSASEKCLKRSNHSRGLGDWSGSEALAAGGNWLLSQQSTDGGWSHSSALPADARLTAQAVCALLAAGCEPVDSIQRGVELLLANQLRGGAWNGETANVGSSNHHPCNPFESAATISEPLLALCRWAREHGGRRPIAPTARRMSASWEPQLTLVEAAYPIAFQPRLYVDAADDYEPAA